MTTTEHKIAALKKSLTLMSRIAGNIMTEDFEEIDALQRVIRDAGCELFELEMSLQPEAEELIAA